MAASDTTPVKEDLSVRLGEIAAVELLGNFIQRANVKLAERRDDGQRLSERLIRSVDPDFDQIITALGTSAEFSLPSLVRAIQAWYADAVGFSSPQVSVPSVKTKTTRSKTPEVERREFVADFIYCLAMIEILKQLPYHPGTDDLLQTVISQAFRHFEHIDSSIVGPLRDNMAYVASLYAELIAVIAQSRFQLVRRKFFTVLREIRPSDSVPSQSPMATDAVVALLLGMQYVRIRTHPIEELESCCQFLRELAEMLVESKEKEIKLALAGLLKSMLLPFAASVKNEVNVPVLRDFVSYLYPVAIDMAARRKYAWQMYQLVTCLLAVSQKTFFLQHWPPFLALCLQQLKTRDTNVSRHALESIYRLAWVYTVRLRCESNAVTLTRMQAVVNSLFPKGAKVVVPRDMAVGIFARIIQFVAHERLDFAMREIVFDLLCVGKPIKILTPERMNIGIRAFLLISDSRQQKEAEPPMPYTTALPSGPQVRPKKNMLTKNFTAEDARKFGLDPYYDQIITAFESILRLLDAQIGRPFMLSRPENWNLSQEEAANMLSAGDRKPKLALFCTCLASIPRILPPAMPISELIDLLSRLTLHMDREISQFALQAMQLLLDDFPLWRVDIISGYIRVIEREIPDGSVPPELMDQAVRRNLLQLLQHWKSAPTPQPQSGEKGQQSGPQPPLPDVLPAFRAVEAFCLVVLCQSSPFNRRFAILLLREVRSMAMTLRPSGLGNGPVIYLADALDRAWPTVVERLRMAMNRAAASANQLSVTSISGTGSLRSRQSPMLPLQVISSQNLNELTWSTLAEKTAPQQQQQQRTSLGANAVNTTTSSAASSSMSTSVAEADSTTDALNLLADDPWFIALSTLLSPSFVYSMCPDLRPVLWNSVYTRLAQLALAIDTGLQASTERTSSILSRSSSRRPAVPVSASDRDSLNRLWLYYLTAAACVMPPSGVVMTSNDYHVVSSDSGAGTMSEEGRLSGPGAGGTTPSSTNANGTVSGQTPSMVTTGQGTVSLTPTTVSVTAFLRLVVPLLKSEVSEVRLAVANALGCACPLAVRDLLEEIMPIAREALERKQENPKRRKRRDSTRLLVLTVMWHLAKAGVFSHHADAQSLLSVSMSNSSEMNATMSHHQLPPALSDLLGSFASLLTSNELDSSDPDIAAACRLRYAELVTSIIDQTAESFREELIPAKLRSTIYDLLCRWAEDLSPSLKESQNLSISSQIVPSDLRTAAVYALCLLVSCGPCWRPSLLDDYTPTAPFYLWLEKLLRSPPSETGFAKAAFEAILLMLDFNPDRVALLDWLFDRCYAGQPDLAETCFAAVASRPDWPGSSDPVAFLCLALANLSSSRPSVHLRAAKLLDRLQLRILPMSVSPSNLSFNSVSATPTLLNASCESHQWLDLVLTSPMSQARTVVAERLAILCPRLTMSVFSEIAHRILPARTIQKKILCQVLQPWLRNVRLVHRGLELAFSGSALDEPEGELFGDSNATPNGNSNSITAAAIGAVTVTAGSSASQSGGGGVGRELSLGGADEEEEEANNLAMGKGNAASSGWGSTEASEMILTNLLYITLKFYDLIPDELSQLWSALSEAWPGNVATIIRYLMVMSALAGAPLLPTIRTIVRLISFGRPQAVVDCLSLHLQCHQPTDLAPERTSTLPYFRLLEARRPSVAQPTAPTVATTAATSLPNQDVLASTVADGDQTVRPAATPSTRPPLTVLNPTDSSPSDDWLTKSATTCATVSAVKTEPQPLPMPAFGGFHAPLQRHLPEEPPLPPATVSRSALAMLLLPDLATDGLLIGDWTAHLPYLLNLVTLTVDDPIALLRENSKRLLLGLIFTAARQSSPPHEKVADLMLAAIAKLPAESRVSRSSGNSCGNMDTARSMNMSPGQGSSSGITCFEPAAAFCFPNNLPSTAFFDVSALSGSSRCSTPTLTPEIAAERILAMLSKRSGQPLWPRDMPSPAVQALTRINAAPSSQFSAPPAAIVAFENLRQFVTLCATLFGKLFPDRSVADRWAQTALHLGTNPPPVGTLFCCRQVACRALRIYRALATPLTGRVLVDVAGRLAEVAADPAEDVQQYAIELSACLELGADMQNIDNDVAARLVWIAASMLESDCEIELVAALRLIEILIPTILNSGEQIQSVANQLRWPAQNGGLLGIIHRAACSSSIASSMGFSLLCRLASCAMWPSFSAEIPGASDVNTGGLVLYTASLLPYWLHHYTAPTVACREAADTLAGLSVHGWDNLGVVLTLYSRQSYTKDVTQWCRCVVKYLMDVCPESPASLLILFTRLLESPLTWVQRAGIEAAFHLISFAELQNSGGDTRLFDAALSLCRLIVRQFSTGPLSRDAHRLLRLFVSKSATFHAPPSTMTVSITSQSLAHTSVDFDTVLGLRRDLPGRTLDFDFDPSQVSDDQFTSIITNGGAADQQATIRRLVNPSALTAPQKQLSVRQHLWQIVRAFGEQQRYLPRAPSILLGNTAAETATTTASAGKHAAMSIGQVGGGAQSGIGGAQTSDSQSVGRTGSIDETSMSEQQFTALRTFDFLYDEEEIDGDSSVAGAPPVGVVVTSSTSLQQLSATELSESESGLPSSRMRMSASVNLTDEHGSLVTSSLALDGEAQEAVPGGVASSCSNGDVLRQSLSSTLSPSSPSATPQLVGPEAVLERESVSSVGGAEGEEDDESLSSSEAGDDREENESESAGEEQNIIEEVDERPAESATLDQGNTTTTDQQDHQRSLSGASANSGKSSASSLTNGSEHGSSLTTNTNVTGDDASARQAAAVVELLLLRRKHQSQTPTSLSINVESDPTLAFLKHADLLEVEQQLVADNSGASDGGNNVTSYATIASLLLLLPRVCRQACLRLASTIESLQQACGGSNSAKDAHIATLILASSQAAQAPDCPLIVVLPGSLSNIAPADLDALVFGLGEVRDAVEAFVDALKPSSPRTQNNCRRLTVLCSGVVAVCCRTATFAWRCICSSSSLKTLDESTTKMILVSESTHDDVEELGVIDGVDGWDDANLRLVDTTMYVLQAMQVNAAVFRPPPSASVASAHLSAAASHLPRLSSANISSLLAAPVARSMSSTAEAVAAAVGNRHRSSLPNDHQPIIIASNSIISGGGHSVLRKLSDRQSVPPMSFSSSLSAAATSRGGEIRPPIRLVSSASPSPSPRRRFVTTPQSPRAAPVGRPSSSPQIGADTLKPPSSASSSATSPSPIPPTAPLENEANDVNNSNNDNNSNNSNAGGEPSEPGNNEIVHDISL